MGLALAPPPGPYVRRVRTPDLGELAAAQPDKNRRYVQLEPGALVGDLLDARLGSVQIFRERLDVGMLVEAAPAANLVPFGILLASRSDVRFCGDALDGASVAQATGGAWDIRFDGPLDYVSWVFERSWFEREVECVRGAPAPADWFRSGAHAASARDVGRLAATIIGGLDRLSSSPALLDCSQVLRRLESEILRLCVEALSSGDPPPRPASYGRRRRGVRRALEYLHDQPEPHVTISALCAVAGVSARTLEYGFREHLGMTPMRYARLVRLNGARRDLLRTAPHATTVTDVALGWGFVELGRFAGEYRRFFGELPSETLRRC